MLDVWRDTPVAGWPDSPRNASGRRRSGTGRSSTIDAFTATMRSRLATDYVAGLTSPAALRDRAFLSRRARGRGEEARGALEQLAKSLDECGNNGNRAAVEFELASLAKHERQVDDARAHARMVQQLLADSPDASLCLRATGLLAELG